MKRSWFLIVCGLLFLSCWPFPEFPEPEYDYAVAFKHEQDVYLINTKTGETLNITESFFDTEYDATPCDFSHDHRYLLFSVDTVFSQSYPPMHRHYADLYRYDMHSGDIVKLTENNFETINAEYAPDDDQIVMMSSYDFRYHIFLMNSDGSDLRDLQDAIQYEYAPTFSPDGEFVYYLRFEDYAYNICRNNLEGTNEELLTFDTYGNKDFCVSSDERWLYYNDYGIVKKNLNTGETVYLTSDSLDSVTYVWPKLSPKGDRLAFYYANGWEYVAGLMTTNGRDKRILHKVRGCTFSPDGKYLFLVGDDNITQYDIKNDTLGILFEGMFRGGSIEVALIDP